MPLSSASMGSRSARYDERIETDAQFDGQNSREPRLSWLERRPSRAGGCRQIKAATPGLVDGLDGPLVDLKILACRRRLHLRRPVPSQVLIQPQVRHEAALPTCVLYSQSPTRAAPSAHAEKVTATLKTQTSPLCVCFARAHRCSLVESEVSLPSKFRQTRPRFK